MYILYTVGLDPRMLTLVAQVTLQDVVDAFLRVQTADIGQTEMAKLIGTRRQGVNAIMNRREGRRFTMEHLERYIVNSGIMTSTLLAELANLAWKRETELKPKGAAPTAPSFPKDVAAPPTIAELADLIRELLAERKKHR